MNVSVTLSRLYCSEPKSFGSSFFQLSLGRQDILSSVSSGSISDKRTSAADGSKDAEDSVHGRYSQQRSHVCSNFPSLAHSAKTTEYGFPTLEKLDCSISYKTIPSNHPSLSSLCFRFWLHHLESILICFESSIGINISIFHYFFHPSPASCTFNALIE